jgi:hypothetical protein
MINRCFKDRRELSVITMQDSFGMYEYGNNNRRGLFYAVSV